jgi:hypothetical protein
MDRQTLIDEQRREYYRLYMREYRKKNKEKVQEHTNRYWARKAAIEVRSLESLEAELEQLKQKI